MTNIIVAVTLDGAIGKDGDQLYYIPGDLKRFKSLTLGNTVIMGRKTFEALPKGALPERKNIVVTGNKSLNPPGAFVADSIGNAIKMAEGEVYIIGGAQIYKQSIDIADRLILTEIKANRPDADTFFPEITPELWSETEVTPWQYDEKCGVEYRYRTLERRN